MALGRFCSVAVLAGCWLGASVSTGFSAKDSAITTSGLPVPRYVSLKSDHVNVRAGPTKDNDVAWVYTRSGLPVEITAEFENWRRVRDSEGAEGWVYHSLLSGRRTAVVTMKTKDDLAPLYDRADPAAPSPPACRPASSPRSRNAPPAGAASSATALTAGSNSSGCGAFTRTRRWSERAISSSSPHDAGTQTPRPQARRAGRRLCSNNDSGGYGSLRSQGRRRRCELSASCAAARPCRRGRSRSLRALPASFDSTRCGSGMSTSSWLFSR